MISVIYQPPSLQYSKTNSFCIKIVLLHLLIKKVSGHSVLNYQNITVDVYVKITIITFIRIAVKVAELPICTS